MKKAKAFTLVEIMIVVAIIALLAAVAIPNLLRARANANDAAAVVALKNLASAAISYRSVNATYPLELLSLAPGYATPAYIDVVLGCADSSGCPKSGYSFSFIGTDNSFAATAKPLVYQTTGNRNFLVNETGAIYFTSSDTGATIDDSALE